MKRVLAYVMLLTFFACGEQVDYDKVPDLGEVTRVVTNDGKTVQGTNYYVDIPAGALSDEEIIVLGRWESLSAAGGDNRIPPFIIRSDDRLALMSSLVTFYPRNYAFKKEIVVGIPGYKSANTFVYELIPGTDSTHAENWVDKTAQSFTLKDGFIGIRTNRFSRYIISTDWDFDSFFLDRQKMFSTPEEFVKPVAYQGRYRARILADEQEMFLLDLYFVNNPVAPSSYDVFNMTSGQLSNTNNTRMEIIAYFDCFIAGGSLNCNKRSVSKSGTLKYLPVQLSSGSTGNKFLFKNVIVRDPTSGKERSLNGMFWLF